MGHLLVVGQSRSVVIVVQSYGNIALVLAWQELGVGSLLSTVKVSADAKGCWVSGRLFDNAWHVHRRVKQIF